MTERSYLRCSCINVHERILGRSNWSRLRETHNNISNNFRLYNALVE